MQFMGNLMLILIALGVISALVFHFISLKKEKPNLPPVPNPVDENRCKKYNVVPKDSKNFLTYINCQGTLEGKEITGPTFICAKEIKSVINLEVKEEGYCF